MLPKGIFTKTIILPHRKPNFFWGEVITAFGQLGSSLFSSVAATKTAEANADAERYKAEAEKYISESKNEDKEEDTGGNTLTVVLVITGVVVLLGIALLLIWKLKRKK
jgi:phage gp46-like protein